MENDSTGTGARIRAARKDRSMTQDDLARAVGVSRSAVAQWETDRSGQVGANLTRVASALGVTAAFLLAGEMRIGADTVAEGATEMALLRLYRACSEEDRAYLMRTARLLSRGPAT